ncbi:putative integral membrane protein [Leucobacter sp. 7(1)]|uniref:FUSC family protein n=1 Tax=Leucobacter sp. 7(1) TaxID=1255613 RepID=UPI00097EDE50|nr:FUSC family protein [Leucobacter sp. 7(1)]SJN11760.1 putative integral membrane protein [Leucobacter sp. 7(1)]
MNPPQTGGGGSGAAGDPHPWRVILHQILRAGGNAVRSLFALPAGPGPRYWIAARAALSIGIPLLVCTLLGRPDLGLQAGAGAFVALFAASAGAAERAKLLPIVGGVLLGCAGLGVALVPSHLAYSFGLVGAAIAVSAFAIGVRLGPPGPVFFVLVYGLAGTITAVRDGERITDPAVFLAAMCGGLLFSYVVALAPLLRSAERARSVRPLRELLPGPWFGTPERELLLRIAIVAVLGTALSLLWLDPSRAYWTVAAGVAVVGLTPGRSHSLGRGLHRTVGTLLGALLYLVIAPLGEHPLTLVLLIMALQFSIELVVVRNYALALVFITPLVLFISSAAAGGTDHWATAGERVLDTAVGSALAVLTVAVHRPTRGS